MVKGHMQGKTTMMLSLWLIYVYAVHYAIGRKWLYELNECSLFITPLENLLGVNEDHASVVLAMFVDTHDIHIEKTAQDQVTGWNIKHVRNEQ